MRSLHERASHVGLIVFIVFSAFVEHTPEEKTVASETPLAHT
jgi:hypothetical protein